MEIAQFLYLVEEKRSTILLRSRSSGVRAKVVEAIEIIQKEERKMNEMMMYGKRIPEYYDTMYLDGYTPYEILYATRKKMFREYQEREAAKQQAQE